MIRARLSHTSLSRSALFTCPLRVLFVTSLLQIFVKHPHPGQTKTRLAAGIGHRKALLAYERLLHKTRAVATELSPVLSVNIWYGNAIPEEDLWQEASFSRQSQWGDDIGTRMYHALQKGFEQGAAKVVLIGSDLPDIHAGLILKALSALDRVPAVIGPAQDGGYYLIGLSQAPSKPLFDGILWSSDQVLVQTRARLQSLGWAWEELEALCDLDTVSDLEGTFLADLLPARSDHPLLQRLSGGSLRTLGEVPQIVKEQNSRLANGQMSEFDVLVDGMWSEKPEVRFRAASAVDKLSRTFPDALPSHADRIFADLDRLVADPAIDMSLPLMLGRIQWQEHQVGKVMNTLEDWLPRTKNIFVRVFILQALTDQALRYPIFAAEVQLMVSAHMVEGSAAVRARGKQLLRILSKIHVKEKLQ